jgi:hypothetical protein
MTMQRKASKLSENSSENSEMTELAFASEAIRTRIAPPGIAQQVKARIRHAARVLGWTFSRTRDVWYGDERVSLKPRELRRVEEASGLRYGREELAENDQLIRRADALLMGSDPDFVSAFVVALRAFAGARNRT